MIYKIKALHDDGNGLSIHQIAEQLKLSDYGISHFPKLATENYYFIDRTVFLEQLESLPESYLVFLRPRRFGKSLRSVLAWKPGFLPSGPPCAKWPMTTSPVIFLRSLKLNFRDFPTGIYQV
ncbi:MAG: AAA family ATPase [SAR324 cluster bacterium]|nr:AAA family ATPase [SAR324 cluster bacterium]